MHGDGGDGEGGCDNDSGGGGNNNGVRGGTQSWLLISFQRAVIWNQSQPLSGYQNLKVLSKGKQRWLGP